MALLNRKNKTDVPAEIQEYYQAERRERTGVAWLLAFGTLIVTILLAAGIFFAGRWTYRQIAGNDENGNNTTQVAQNEDRQEETSRSDTRQDTNGSATDEGSEDQNTERESEESAANREPSGQSGSTSGGSGQVDDGAARTDEPSGDVAGESDDREIVVTGDALPSTGAGDTVAIFLAISILGYAVHRAATNKAIN